MRYKRNQVSNFNIEGDFDLYSKIVSDMRDHAGILAPAENWGVDIKTHSGQEYFDKKEVAYFDDIRTGYCEKYASLKLMLDPWVGCVGMQNVSEATLKKYVPFIKLIDDLNLVDDCSGDYASLCSEMVGVANTDLGTAIDLNLISQFSKSSPLSFVEVGGGYGRLAEGALSVFGKSRKIFYLMLDAVPASLMYAYKYIKSTFPELKVGFYYNNDAFDPDFWDCYVMPSWHYGLSNYKFDVCVNVQSMQEMSQAHVDYYLNLFGHVVKDDGIIYLSNEKNYIFQGRWSYPDDWGLVFKSRTPRSWTRDSPTEIFVKSGNGVLLNKGVDLMYKIQLLQFDEGLNKEADGESSGNDDSQSVLKPSKRFFRWPIRIFAKS